MSNVNRAAYAAAHRRVAAGRWRVNAESGLVIGWFGKPIGWPDAAGYIRILVREDRKQVGHIGAHRLIWEHIHGPIPDGLEINHRNGIKHDNRLANLEVVTPGENGRHAFATGLKSFKAGHPRAKLTKEQVEEIRAALATGESQYLIARRFSISQPAISKIKLGRTWQQ